ncbi:UNVERIFIED_ORG: hypothetical protein E4P37_13290 [Bacillus sp. AZ43]
MPDSLTALAIVALVGLPGYVYIGLVPRKASEQRRNPGLNVNFEIVLFGLTFGVTGTMLAVFSATSLWARVLAAYTWPGAALTVANVLDSVLAVILAFVGALGVATLAGGAMRRFSRGKKGGKTLTLVVVSGLVVGGFLVFGVLGLCGVIGG